MTKNIILLLLLGTLLSNYATAQDDPALSRYSRFYYFKKNGQLTDIPDTAGYTRTFSPDTARNSILYVVEEAYNNGKTKLKGKSTTSGPYFKGQGDFTWYYPNGQVWQALTYENGKITGPYTVYYPNGKTEESALYADGKLTGERVIFYPNGNKQFINKYEKGVVLSYDWYFPSGKPYYYAVYDTAKKLEIVRTVYDLAGNVTASNGNGTLTLYADSFKRIFSKGQIVNGLKDGEWKGKLSDTLNTFVCTYNNGVFLSGTTTFGATGKTVQYDKEETEPTFTGGIQAFYKQLAGNVKYPRWAKENNIQGKVFLTFVIDKEGKMVDIKILRGIGGGCDEAAMEALEKISTLWSPGVQYGIPVRVQYNIPVSFTLKGM